MTSSGIISAGNLTKYYGSHRGIRDVSFDVKEGEIFGFLGPSGAGKSTTQKVLTRLLRNYTGEVQILGKDLHTWHSEFYDHIGVGFELPTPGQRI